MLILEHNYKELKKLSRLPWNDPKYNCQICTLAQSFIDTFYIGVFRDNTVGHYFNENMIQYKRINPKLDNEFILVGYLPNSLWMSHIYEAWYKLKHNIDISKFNSTENELANWLMDPMTNIKMIDYETDLLGQKK